MGSFVGLRFEAPDPEPAQKPQGQVESKPNAGGPKPPATEKNEDLDALKNEMQELRETNRSLIELVGRQTPAPQREAAPAADEVEIDWGKDEDIEETPEEPEDPAQLVEDLSKLGPQALVKRGYVRKADVIRIVREESRKAAATAATQVVKQARNEVTRESAVMREFPELADPESELFKATAAHVRAAVKIDPSAAKNPATLFLAAQAAKAGLRGDRGDRGRGRDSERDQLDDDFDTEEDEREPVMRERRPATERDRRIAAQQGDRGRTGRSRIQSDDDGFVMSEEARSVASQMGITDEEYKTEALRIRKAAGASSGRRR